MSNKDPEIIAKVEGVIEQLRPFLHSDGGDMELVEITDDNVIRVKLLGSCRECSMSEMTMRAGIEEQVKSVLPFIKSVEAVSAEIV